MSTFFVLYPGELSGDDREALGACPDLKLYENGYGQTSVWMEGYGTGTFTAYQVVRVEAPTVTEARQQVIDALGREPDGLRASPGVNDSRS